MARYQIILAYDGTNFEGYQRQKGRRTVQGVFEAALSRLGWEGGKVLSAGRTDSGVHAAGQVIAFDLDWKHGIEALGEALNALLPADAAVQRVGEVRADFHPRYDARARTYRYQVYCHPLRNPIAERFAFRSASDLDVSRLQAAADCFIGTHDFSAFGAPMKTGGSTIRSILKAEWQQDGNMRTFWIEANAFLYHMVRRLVYLQIQAALEKVTLDELRGGVEHASPLKPGIAPSNGLMLWSVRYHDGMQE